MQEIEINNLHPSIYVGIHHTVRPVQVITETRSNIQEFWFSATAFCQQKLSR